MLEPIAVNQVPTSNIGVAALACLMGVSMVALGITERRGQSLRLRQQVIRTYRWGTDRFRRNAPFTLIPGGIWFLLGGVAFAQRWPRWFYDSLMMVVLIGVAVTVWFLWRPPCWAKPRWLAIEEASAFPSLEETLPTGHGVLIWIRVVLVMALTAGILIATIVVTTPSTGAFIGLALVGAGAAVAYRQQQRRSRAALENGGVHRELSKARDSDDS